MTIDNVLEILEKHKLRIPSNVFYELKADIVNFEDPTTKNDLAVDCISRAEVTELLKQYYHSESFTDEQKRVIYELAKDVQYFIHSVEAIPKDQYEARLKADMIAMLTDIQLEIEELDLKDSIPDYTSGAEDTRDYITNMIEETIDKLKGV